MKEIKLTKEGFERIQRTIEGENIKLIEAIRILREQMEASDDAEDTGLEDAKREKALIEARIDELEDTLSRATVIEVPADTDKVALGSFISLREEKSGREMEVQLVSGPEASILDPNVKLLPKVSDDSPLGQELLGKKTGDLFIVNLGNRQLKYKVLSINTHK